MAKQELAADERTVVYETSGKMYQQAFASTALFGLLFVIGGAMFLYDEELFPGAILLGLGVMLGIRSAGSPAPPKNTNRSQRIERKHKPANKITKPNYSPQRHREHGEEFLRTRICANLR